MKTRTTLNLDDTLVKDAQKIVGARTKTELVEAGLRELIARSRQVAIAIAGEGSIPELVVPPRRTPPRWKSR